MTTKNHSHDLYDDVAKIKKALMEATEGVKYKAGEALTESVDSIREKACDVKDCVEDYAENQPFKSLGIAMLAGVFIGYMMKK
jgi:ElaB/YqjD/DUF883 family membrane-anchored ribosome-binding protein